MAGWQASARPARPTPGRRWTRRRARRAPGPQPSPATRRRPGRGAPRRRRGPGADEGLGLVVTERQVLPAEHQGGRAEPAGERGDGQLASAHQHEPGGVRSLAKRIRPTSRRVSRVLRCASSRTTTTGSASGPSLLEQLECLVVGRGRGAGAPLVEQLRGRPAGRDGGDGSQRTARPRHQSATSAVLPAPKGATTWISDTPSTAPSSTRCSRWRVTTGPSGRGGLQGRDRSLVETDGPRLESRGADMFSLTRSGPPPVRSLSVCSGPKVRNVRIARIYS